VRSFLALLFVSASLTVAQAQNIPISNHSFENPPLADGGSSLGITGWSGGGVFGVINPTAAQFTSQAPDGANVAFIQTDTSSNFFGSFDQTLNAVVTANTTYTLMVDVGRSFTEDFGSFQVTLGVNDQNRSSLVFATGPAPAAGMFTTLVLTYFAGEDNQFLGQQLTVGATSFNSFAGGNATDVVYFDNFRLSAVPEPSSIALFGFGAAGAVACVFRRRRARA
jgi:hypothetical protein